jgi:hypothetical protein
MRIRRHSTAVHLLRAGIDITTISHWLGHASVTITNRYASVDLEMKRKAIEQARPTDFPADGPARWRTDVSTLEWLESLRAAIRNVEWWFRNRAPRRAQTATPPHSYSLTTNPVLPDRRRSRLQTGRSTSWTSIERSRGLS